MVPLAYISTAQMNFLRSDVGYSDVYMPIFCAHAKKKMRNSCAFVIHFGVYA